jgi:hypothetical protein
LSEGGVLPFTLGGPGCGSMPSSVRSRIHE